MPDLPDEVPTPATDEVPPLRSLDGVPVRLDAVVADRPGFRPLTVDVLRPPQAAPDAVLPLVVWVHGGAWLFGSSKHDAGPLLPGRVPAVVLDAGYALARVGYRLTAEAPFPAQLEDVKAAVRWLRAHAAVLGVDPGRFAAWGESAGGHLASLLALTGDRADGPVPPGGVSDAVQAALVWYGPADLATMQAQALPAAGPDHDAADSPESLLVGAPVQADPARTAAASPVSWAHAGTPPVRLVHGTADRVVPAAQSEQLHAVLTGLGAPCELRLVPGADHCFGGADLGPLVRDALGFLDRTIGPGPR